MRRSQLKTAIANAFASVPPPGPKNIPTPEHCDECASVSRDFAKVSWTEVSAEVIDRNYDKLPLLSSEAFHHFLPAFLTRALEDRGGLVWEFVFYSLTGKPDDWQTGRLSLLNRDQILVVIDYLKLTWDDCQQMESWLITEKVLRKRLEFWEELLSSKSSI